MSLFSFSPSAKCLLASLLRSSITNRSAMSRSPAQLVRTTDRSSLYMKLTASMRTSGVMPVSNFIDMVFFSVIAVARAPLKK